MVQFVLRNFKQDILDRNSVLLSEYWTAKPSRHLQTTPANRRYVVKG